MVAPSLFSEKVFPFSSIRVGENQCKGGCGTNRTKTRPFMDISSTKYEAVDKPNKSDAVRDWCYSAFSFLLKPIQTTTTNAKKHTT